MMAIDAFESHDYFKSTPALTTRGLKESDMEKVVEFIDAGLKLALEITQITGPKIVDFNKALDENPDVKIKVQKLKDQVEAFSNKFPMPGYTDF